MHHDLKAHRLRCLDALGMQMLKHALHTAHTPGQSVSAVGVPAHSCILTGIRSGVCNGPPLLVVTAAWRILIPPGQAECSCRIIALLGPTL
jgi:hypothetical protein